MKVILCSRASVLAKIQAEMVGAALLKACPDVEVLYHLKDAAADVDKVSSLISMSKGSFTVDLTNMLKNKEVDCVVHSWKDLPLEITDGTELCATLPRADMRDLVLFEKSRIDARPKVLRILSSSPRRAYNLESFLLQALPYKPEKIEFLPVRGNIPTRLRKLHTGDATHGVCDALVVAKAALDRILVPVHEQFVPASEEVRALLAFMRFMVIPLSISPCAPAQGAVAVEICSDRKDLKALFSKINCSETFRSVERERSILKRYGGGCHQKIGVACFERPYGRVTITKGATDQGEILDSHVLDRLQEERAPQVALGKSWPFDAAPTDQLETKRITREFDAAQISDAKALWVSQAAALPLEVAVSPETLVSCAGVSTWKKLAARGVWVHSCADGLGERESLKLEALAPHVQTWLKLAHDKSDGAATYTVEHSLPQSLEQYTHFFWRSGTQFLAAVQKFPEIVAKFHGCGVGNSYHLIKEELDKRESGASKRLWACLSEEAWKKEIQ